MYRMFRREYPCHGASCIHVKMEWIDPPEFSTNHQAKRLAQCIVPLIPFNGGEPCPDVCIVQKLVESSGLENLSLDMKGNIPFVVKGASKCTPSSAGKGTTLLNFLPMDMSDLEPGS